MANQEQLDILKQGVEVWNRWREEHDDIQPDLREAVLTGHRLTEFTGIKHTIRHALHGVDLHSTDLRRADLRGADLRDADLRDADLSYATFTYANLRGADLSDAGVSWTTFGDVNLSEVKGLETVEHGGPSSIGIDTIYNSKGNIPEIFLKGVGVDDTFITYIRSLIGKPIEYYSCFICYSSKDETFAKRLYNDLQSNNVRCWFAPEDMKIGDRIRPRIDESVHMYDRLLLVLSEHSVSSKWVEFEVEAAMDKEQEGKPTVLFPVRLDNTVMESTTAWAAHIKRTRHIGDFTSWKNLDNYQKAFTRLLRDLKAEA
jgi:hypothetical protein